MMGVRICCNAVSLSSSTAASPRAANHAATVAWSRARRLLTFTRWSLPAAILLLLPKCPACLAAYVALGTGVGLGMAASSHLRWLLVGICAVTLILNALLFGRKWLRLHWKY